MEQLTNISGNFLSFLDAQMIIKSLSVIDIKNIISPKWFKQRDSLEKLNIQAHNDVIQKKGDDITAEIISQNKVPVLIHELIVIEIWKHKVATLIEEELSAMQSKSNIIPYLIYYYEAIIVNLLEILLYNKDAIPQDECLLELIDYCQRKFNLLNIGKISSSPPEAQDVDLSEEKRFELQKKEIEFGIAMSALSIFRFITDNISEMHPSAVNRILDTHDSLFSLIYLLDKAPWMKRERGKILKYINGKWEKVPHEDFLKLTQPEAQVWLSINNLLVDPIVRQKYEYTSIRRDTVLRLKKYFNDVLLDQVPILEDARRLVEELHITVPADATQNKSMLIIEQVPIFRDNILKSTDWEELADQHLNRLATMSDKEKQQIIISMAQLYGEISSDYNNEEVNVNINTK